mmetsp:Transcript_27633/g.57240  ORF Transcript_27633/g.57240 Transcript_27633/m.57240 type:complete len:250 (-) Transcript_27633:850-1599(-)
MEEKVLVERVPWNDRPVVKDRMDHRLSLRVGSKVRLEAEGIQHREESLDVVEEGPRDGPVPDNMSPAAFQEGLDRRDHLRGALDLDPVDGFHQPGRRRQQGRVDRLAGRRDDLSTAPVDRLVGQNHLQDLELCSADGFLAERALPGRPLEALDDARPAGCQQLLVDLAGEGVVQEEVRPAGRGVPKGPHRPGGEQVPSVLGLEEPADLALVPLSQLDPPGFEFFRQTLVHRLGDEGQLVFFCWWFPQNT